MDESDLNAQRISAISNIVRQTAGDAVTSDSNEDTPARQPIQAPTGAASIAGCYRPANGDLAGSGHRREATKRDAVIVEREQRKSRRVERLVASTGNQLVDQFRPWYFGIAFAFLFKYCIGMPDPPAFTDKPRHRRPAHAPRIEIERWTQTMA